MKDFLVEKRTFAILKAISEEFENAVLYYDNYWTVKGYGIIVVRFGENMLSHLKKTKEIFELKEFLKRAEIY